jgi:hypothetical protein
VKNSYQSCTWIYNRPRRKLCDINQFERHRMLLLSVTKIFNIPPARGYQHISDGLSRLIRQFRGCVNGIRSVDRQDTSLGVSAPCRPSHKDSVPQLREIPRWGDFTQPAVCTQQAGVSDVNLLNVCFKNTTKRMVVFEIQLVKKKFSI